MTPQWSQLQDKIIRQILAEMGRQRMTSRGLCVRASLSESLE